MSHYQNFFSLHQVIQTQSSTLPLEIVWGIGVARWRCRSQTINHPLVEQLVEIEVDPNNRAIIIRPREIEPMVHLKPFFFQKNSGASSVLNFSNDFFDNIEDDEELSPFTEKTFVGILRSAASHLDKNGVYHPDTIPDITDRNLPEITEHLSVTDTWAIYARKRSDNFFIQDLSRLRKEISGCETLQQTAHRLVNEPEDNKICPSGGIDLGLTSLSGFQQIDSEIREETDMVNVPHTQDYFFPKPYNEQQKAIVKRLEISDGVVVQGPPGTGKTHSIANIICHYLATGKRVLVTSKTESALTVLRNHIPEEIRELAISLLTNEKEGLKQLEKAVGLLSNIAALQNAKRLEENILIEQQQIIDLKGKVASIESELLIWAKKNLEPLNLDDTWKGILPIDVAKEVVTTRDQHNWLPDQLNGSGENSPQFSDTDIQDVREARKALKSDLYYLKKTLPSPNDLPSFETIISVHLNLVAAHKLREDPAVDDLPDIRTGVVSIIERSEKLGMAINKFFEISSDFGEMAWLKGLFEKWRTADSEDVEVAILNELLPEMRSNAEQRLQIIKHAIIVPADIHVQKVACEAIRRAKEGKRPFGILQMGKSRDKALLQQVKVAGRLPDTPEDWKKVFDFIIWRQEQASLVARWNAVAYDFQMPEIQDDGQKTGLWISETYKKLNRIKAFINTDMAIIQEESARLFPVGMEGAKLLSSEDELKAMSDALLLNSKKIRLEGARDELRNSVECIDACSGTISERIGTFLHHWVGSSEYDEKQIAAQWQDLSQELNRLHELNPFMDTVRRVSALMELSGAPLWAWKLSNDPFICGHDFWTPAYWQDSWIWSQTNDYLSRIDGKSRIQALFQEKHRHEELIQKKLQEVVKLRTYLGLKHNITERVESSLLMFTTAIRKIGKGTGIRARRFRKDARVAMERSYSAVPCWIMPTWRVSESLPSVLGAFDLVIIDEASQSDISALPTLLRAKKLLVVGDDKQVSPTGAFIEEQKLICLRQNYLKNQPFASLMLPGTSLYDLANAMFPGRRIMLQEHFRCVEPIIRFSMQFYSEKIYPLRISKASERIDPPLVDVYVPNGIKNKQQINVKEAEAVVDEIVKLVNDPCYAERSIGVVSLIGAKQAHYIQSLLLGKIGEDSYLRHRIACGDSATFQGKEKDIMFISMVECVKTKSAKTSLLFEQRFNVALSRARDRMYLYRSVTEEMLKPNDLKLKVIQHFNEPMADSTASVDVLADLCQSGFERSVLERLLQMGYRVTPQVKVGPYSIDLVVEGFDDRRLAVELDGDQYHTPDRWADDFNRQQVLERVGWHFWRCWGSSYYLDPDGCIQDLVATLGDMGIEPIGEQPQGSSRFVEHRIYRENKVQTDSFEDSVDNICSPVEVAYKKYPVSQNLEEGQENPAPVGKQQNSITAPVIGHPNETDSVLVDVGDSVLISYNDDPMLQHTIRISHSEHDPDMKIIHHTKPLGQELLGAHIDEEIEIPAGGGKRTVTVLDIKKFSESNLDLAGERINQDKFTHPDGAATVRIRSSAPITP